MPRLEARLEPPPRPEGLLGTAGAREVEEPPRVAMQVGRTKDGSELPANLEAFRSAYLHLKE